MEKYDHKKIEQKWRERWEQANIYKTDEGQGQDKRKCYVLDMFPYPSGDGLHVGHPKGYIATDIYSRFKKMNGFSVLHPMGWDAFGLPAENYAIKNKVHPRVAVSKNIARFKEQLGRLGFNYDWSREINTTDPAYYKWTQWIFLKLLEKGLAYESHEPINWCPSCQTGLANEDLENGRCERCGSAVEKRPMRQWMLKITDYAERLLKDLDELEWPESIKESQRNWIGRSTGSEIKFLIKHFSRNNAELTQKIAEESQRNKINVFTTRPDTLFGVTFMAISPELAQKWLNVSWLPSEEVKKYIGDTLTTRATQSVKDNPEKTGIFSGVYATNPANQEDIPVWVVNYVLGDVGTGAIMAVPAHDERDYEFAKKFKLPIVEVIQGGDVSKGAYIGEGVLINSSQFDKLPSEKAKKKITEFVGGEMATTYRLKDWVFSRQRYWGEPIPVIHCDRCNVVPVPEKDLPVMLPEVERYEPTGTGESPLAAISEWVNTTCPTCGGPAKRETNTMPQWAGSSWYYIAYCISESLNPSAGGQVSIPISGQISKPEFRNNITRWLPVDMYVGGTEHATRHLIYARFWQTGARWANAMAMLLIPTT
ncbi:MAG: Leucine-tRNA ligase [Parcubacteria group bacterium GW2011_GWC1_51_35]|nr:MAG: Leucine-tRNA ligase [Parcubacteria group bacterium GW2011_GWC1_51_35]